MKKRILLIALFVFAAFPLPVTAIDTPPPQVSVLIAALQTGQVGAAGNDFVVLHNPGDEAIDVTGWKLQYRSASAKATDTWTTKRVFSCADVAPDCKVAIPAGQNLIASTYEIPALAAQKMSSGFSDTGGQIRLVRPIGSANQLEVIDMVGYGNAAEAEGDPAVAPADGKAIIRKSNAIGLPVDTGSNKNDFSEGCYAPVATGVPVLAACIQPPQDPPPPDEEDEDQEVPVIYTALEISELLPDPVAPAADSKDEFIEIRNPSTEDVQLKGYVVQAGADFKDTYTFDEQLLPAGGYVSLLSADSHISLTNNGAAVRLLDPSGKVIAVVPNYGQAKPGAAWIQVDTIWQWTLQPTPGAANALLVEPPVVPAVAAPKKATTKKAIAKTASTTKAVKGATTTKPKAPAAAKTAAATPPPEPQPAQNFNFLILTVVGLGVLAYALFEYRHEITRLGRRAWATITR